MPVGMKRELWVAYLKTHDCHLVDWLPVAKVSGMALVVPQISRMNIEGRNGKEINSDV